MTWARVGVKCVCIKRGEWVNRAPSCLEDKRPAYNEVCQVTEIEIRNERVMLRLAGYLDLYYVGRFRPLVTRTQDEDVALFTHHLDKVGEPV